MGHRPQINLPPRTLFVHNKFVNTRPYYSTIANALADAVSGDVIISWDDKTPHIPKSGVTVKLMNPGYQIRTLSLILSQSGTSNPTVDQEIINEFGTISGCSRTTAGVYGIDFSSWKMTNWTLLPYSQIIYNASGTLIGQVANNPQGLVGTAGTLGIATTDGIFAADSILNSTQINLKAIKTTP